MKHNYQGQTKVDHIETLRHYSVSHKNQQETKDVFIERIPIDGTDRPVCFTFRILNGEYRIEYKIRATNPECDFNMSQDLVNGNTVFRFNDENEVPAWFDKDKNVQTKLSNAIVNSL